MSGVDSPHPTNSTAEIVVINDDMSSKGGNCHPGQGGFQGVLIVLKD
jgi:hypothetical protein